MSKFIPRHIFAVLSPTIYISVLTGTCIFYLKRTGNRYDLEITKTARLMAIARVVLYIVFVTYAMMSPDNLKIFTYYDSVLENLGIGFEVAVGTILVFVVYISSITTGDRTKVTLVKLSKLDKILNQLNGDLRYRETYFYQFYNMLFGFSGYLMISVAQYANAKNIGLLQLAISLRIIIYFPMFLAFVMECQYIAIIVIIRYRFQCINEQIAEMDKERIFIINDLSKYFYSKNLK